MPSFSSFDHMVEVLPPDLVAYFDLFECEYFILQCLEIVLPATDDSLVAVVRLQYNNSLCLRRNFFGSNNLTSIHKTKEVVTYLRSITVHLKKIKCRVMSGKMS